YSCRPYTSDAPDIRSVTMADKSDSAKKADASKKADAAQTEPKTVSFKLHLDGAMLKVSYKNKDDLYDSLQKKLADLGISITNVYTYDHENHPIQLKDADAAAEAASGDKHKKEPVLFSGSPDHHNKHHPFGRCPFFRHRSLSSGSSKGHSPDRDHSGNHEHSRSDHHHRHHGYHHGAHPPLFGHHMGSPNACPFLAGFGSSHPSHHMMGSANSALACPFLAGYGSSHPGHHMMGSASGACPFLVGYGYGHGHGFGHGCPVFGYKPHSRGKDCEKDCGHASGHDSHASNK
ncbi:hypothetical protein V3C99_003406, partial [Haemonchus contortus]